MLRLSLLLFTFSALAFDLVASSAQYCKPVPGGSRWPSIADWNTLNETVGGRLLAPTPPGAVCQPSSPLFNNESCAELVSTQWPSSDWHAKNPVTADYNDDTCLPSPLAPCSGNGYPEYVVNATRGSDVQAAVRFAKRTGVRLIVKGTGHDFPGRSSGGNSLSIWTHYIRGIKTMKGDKRAVAHGAPAAVKISAGMRMVELYTEMAKQKLTVMGGADPHVGVGGWTTGGGHGPLTSIYGLGADQVLEMEVVTADGEYRVVNEKTYPNLFWAIRGGGGSTFGVFLSVTVKAYPATNVTDLLYSYNTTADSESFWSLVAYFHQQIPHVNDAGGMGYYFIVPRDTTEEDASQRGKLYGVWLFPNKTAEQAASVVKPMEDHIRAAKWGDKVIPLSVVGKPAEFNTMWKENEPQSVGPDARLGSWLLGKEALSKDLNTLKSQFRKAGAPSPNMILGHVIAGMGVRNANIPGGSNAVLPAWRKAYTHVVLPRGWPFLNATAKEAITKDLRDVRVPALTQLQPDCGAYMNEADPTNPNWQHDYYGANYKRLLQIKKQWDPTGVFWCKPCVGNELWEVKNWAPTGQGVGQDVERLCRK